MTIRPSRPVLPAVKGLRPIPTPVTLVPLRCPESSFFSSQPNQFGAQVERFAHVRTGERSLPRTEPAVVPRRVSLADLGGGRRRARGRPCRPAARAMATICAPPGARWADRGGVFRQDRHAAEPHVLGLIGSGGDSWGGAQITGTGIRPTVLNQVEVERGHATVLPGTPSSPNPGIPPAPGPM